MADKEPKKKRIIAEVDEDLHTALKVKVAKEKTTVSEKVRELIKEYLEKDP